MGFNTEYLGQLTITPPLNPAEVQWLLGFADWGGLGGDAFSLPMNPRAELAAALDRAGGSLPRSHAIPWEFATGWCASTEITCDGDERRSRTTR